VDTESPKTLPKMLPGAVCAEWKTCGKPTCRCARGHLHGPYYYRYWRDGGRLRKAYVPRRAVADVKRCCEARHLHRLAIKNGWDDYHQMLRALREAFDR
jgi:Family of unknown function (DUF6788)